MVSFDTEDFWKGTPKMDSMRVLWLRFNGEDGTIIKLDKGNITKDQNKNKNKIQAEDSFNLSSPCHEEDDQKL